MEPNDLFIMFGGMILVWTMGMFIGYAIGKSRKITTREAAQVMAKASHKYRNSPMWSGGKTGFIRW